MASKLSKWFKRNRWALPLGIGGLALAAPWAVGLFGGGAAGAGTAGAAGAGAAGLGTAGAGGATAGAGAGAITGGLPGLNAAGGLRGLMAAHPGWTGALKGAGSFGVEQLMGRLNQPEVPPQFQPGWDQLGGFDGPDENDPAAAQLARLRAYFSGRYGGGGYNA